MPATRMMISDITPEKNISLTVSRKRRKLTPEYSRVNAKKRAAKPRRQTAFTLRFPNLLTLFMTGIFYSGPQVQTLFVIAGRIMERDRSVHLAIDELAHERLFGTADFVRRAFRDDCAIRNEINVIHDLQRLLHVMRHHNGSRPQRVIQAADQL